MSDQNAFTKADIDVVEEIGDQPPELRVSAGDEEFGGTEERKKLEKKLLRKLDLRMSILIVIYILNYVRLRHDRHSSTMIDRQYETRRLIETMHRE